MKLRSRRVQDQAKIWPRTDHDLIKIRPRSDLDLTWIWLTSNQDLTKIKPRSRTRIRTKSGKERS